MKIVPVLLADNFEEFLFRFRQAEAFADCVQVDLMGGVDYVCVGSRIFLDDDPGEKYNLFVKKLAEIEVKRPV